MKALLKVLAAIPLLTTPYLLTPSSIARSPSNTPVAITLSAFSRLRLSNASKPCVLCRICMQNEDQDKMCHLVLYIQLMLEYDMMPSCQVWNMVHIWQPVQGHAICMNVQ